MEILTVKYPCTIDIIAICATLVLLVVAGCGGCCKISGIWNKRLISDQLWNLVCVIIGWVCTRSISLWPAVFLGMALLDTLVTSHIWLDKWPSYIATNISSVEDPEVNFLQSLVDLLLNGHSLCLRNWSLVLRLLLSGSRFPPHEVFW